MHMDMIPRFLSVAVVLGALAILTAWLRRPHLLTGVRRSRPKQVETMERLTLAPNLSIQVIRVGDSQIVLAVHPSGVTVLDRIAAPNEEVIRT